MKKILVKLICILLIVACIFAITNGVDATSEIIKNKFKGNSGSEGSEAVKQILSAILSVVMLMSIGAKYIVASAGDRADIKKYAINYVIGAIILLGATGVLSVVQNIINKSLE